MQPSFHTVDSIQKKKKKTEKQKNTLLEKKEQNFPIFTHDSALPH